MNNMHNNHQVKRQSQSRVKKTHMPHKPLTYTRNQNHPRRHKQNHRCIQHNASTQIRITTRRSSHLMCKMNRNQQHSQQIPHNMQKQRFPHAMGMPPLHKGINRRGKSNIQGTSPTNPMHRRMANAEQANLEIWNAKNT